MRASRNVLVAVLLLLAGHAQAQDWPRWRGAQGDGVARSTDWSPRGRKLWSRNVGLGFSSASVVGARLYTLGFDPEHKVDRVVCLSADTGAELWSHSYRARLRDADSHDGGTQSTPAVTAEQVFVTSSEGWVRALDPASGEVQWARAVSSEIGTVPDKYGFSISPVPFGSTVIVGMDRVVGLAAEGGEILWRSEPVGAHHSTPTLFELGGEPRLAVFGEDEVCVLDPSSGRKLYTYPWHEGHVGKSVATPVAIGARIFVSAAQNRGGALLEFDGEVRALWTSLAMRNTMAGCVLVGEHLYGFDESLLKCIDLEGRELWRERGLGNGALSAAGARLVLLSSKGELIVAEASPAGYQERWRERLFDEGSFFSPPVFAGGRIYTRSSLGEVVCTDHRSEPAPGPVPVAAPLAALPEARSLFAGHLARVGGAERVRRVRSIRWKGKFELRSMGVLSTDVEVLQLAPDLRREVIQFPHGLRDQVIRVYDGEVAYELNRIQGDRLLEADEQREVRESSQLHAAAEWEASYRSMRTVGLVVFADRPAYRVETVLASGAERMVYFDPATGFLLGREGPSESLVIHDDWRAFDGLYLPMYEKRFLRDTGVEETLRFHEVELDTLTRAAFARPAQVEELMRSREVPR